MFNAIIVSPVVFYGLAIFCRKPTQFCVTRCERCSPETPSFCDDVQRTGNMRKDSFFELENTRKL